MNNETKTSAELLGELLSKNSEIDDFLVGSAAADLIMITSILSVLTDEQIIRFKELAKRIADSMQISGERKEAMMERLKGIID